MKDLSCKIAASFGAVFTAGTLFAGCQTAETVEVAAAPGGSAVIVEECAATANCPAAQKAKQAMQPAAACQEDKCTDKDKKANTVEVTRQHQCPMAEFEKESTKLATTLAHAFKNGDAKAFINALPANLRKDFDEKKFLEAHKLMTNAMGEVVSADFVTDLKHPVLSIQLWKIGFKKISKDAGEFTQQALFQVTIGEVDKKAQVVSFGFI